MKQENGFRKGKNEWLDQRVIDALKVLRSKMMRRTEWLERGKAPSYSQLVEELLKECGYL